MKIAIVGAGRLAATLAPALLSTGHTITEIVARHDASSLRRARTLARKLGAQSVVPENAQLNAKLIWFCVPDGKIREAAERLVDAGEWKGKIAFHSSGALSSDELNSLRKRGAGVASVHPLMTFVRGSRPGLRGVPFALEGDRSAISVARQITNGFHAKPFVIRKHDKALYHAWGTFASPLLIALLATTEQVARASGVSIPIARKRMLPILNQTLANYAVLGPAQAFSGPIVRGDAEVVRRQLSPLKKVPEARRVYLALARSALHFLPTKNRAELRKIFLSEP
jgi:predicted short-subunit dehydrogenase-like oxidoreductase (DUF2520 family)